MGKLYWLVQASGSGYSSKLVFCGARSLFGFTLEANVEEGMDRLSATNMNPSMQGRGGTFEICTENLRRPAKEFSPHV